MPNKNPKNKFTQGNNAAEKWTPETVLPVLEAIWKTLCENKDDPDDKNIVRANDIKLLGEVCLMHDVTKQRWNEWDKKFEGVDSVSDLIKKIKWVLECRLNYSGQTMDIFILKNHYEYSDKREIEHGASESFLDFLKQTSASG